MPTYGHLRDSPIWIIIILLDIGVWPMKDIVSMRNINNYSEIFWAYRRYCRAIRKFNITPNITFTVTENAVMRYIYRDIDEDFK